MLGGLLIASIMIAIGYLRAEDEVQPRGQVPPELIETIQGLLDKQAFDGMILEHDNEEGVVFDYTYHCDKYRVHGSRGYGGPADDSSSVLGPTQDGFRLTLRWQESWLGYASEDGFGRVRPQYYWHTYINHYKIHNSQGYIRLDWELGTLADREILADVRAELEAIGTPVAKEPLDRWEPQVEKLQSSLSGIVSKLQPKAKWRRDGESLVCQYNTQEYDIHTVGEDGDVALDAHREVGPQHEGFIIRLSRLEDVVKLQGQPRYGRTDGPYWKRFFAVYDHGQTPYRLDLYYGWGVDKKVLEEVTAALENPNITPERF